MEFQVTVDELDDGSKCNEAAESCQLSVTFVMLIYLFGLSMLNIRPLFHATNLRYVAFLGGRMLDCSSLMPLLC